VTSSSLDAYLEGSGLLHRRDPRAKLLATLTLVLALVLTPVGSWVSFGLFGLIIVAVIAASGIPPVRLLRRTVIVLPFVLPAVLFLPFLHGGDVLWQAQVGGWHISLGRTGLVLAGSIVIKAILSALVLGLLMATTRMSDLLRGLSKLGVPRILTALFGFMYRYLFVLQDEALRLKAGRDVRYYGGLRVGISSVGHMAGSLFLRSYDRAERVYGAMLLRGYDGAYRSLNQLRVNRVDILMVFVAVALVVPISLITRLI